MDRNEVIRVFVGTDRSQFLGVKVLQHSIERYTTAKVEVVPMLDLPVPKPKDPRNSQRTGFSFSRFCIPALAGYHGKAIYMDADMQVFTDIRKLWEIPFDGAKVVIQREVKHTDKTMAKEGAPQERKKQCAVMLLDCENLKWDINEIVAGLDRGDYNYDQLVYDLCILDESEVKYGVPFEWNSLEYYDKDTCLIHYTDMATQPWVSTKNPRGNIWFEEVRLMMRNGSLTWAELEQEIELGYLRPSLVRELKYGHMVPSFLRGCFNASSAAYDKMSGYVAHKAVYESKRIRAKAIAEFERIQRGLAS